LPREPNAKKAVDMIQASHAGTLVIQRTGAGDRDAIVAIIRREDLDRIVGVNNVEIVVQTRIDQVTGHPEIRNALVTDVVRINLNREGMIGEINRHKAIAKIAHHDLNNHQNLCLIKKLQVQFHCVHSAS
jgi:hypothetical protein